MTKKKKEEYKTYSIYLKSGNVIDLTTIPSFIDNLLRLTKDEALIITDDKDKLRTFYLAKNAIECVMEKDEK